MPNIASVLKAEIARLAKKEAKAATTKLQRTSAQHRSDIAKLRKLLTDQARELSALRKQAQARGLPPAELEPESNTRFSARSVRAQRKRLGLSAEDYGKLVGVSRLTIYKWETGKAHPRKAQLERFLAVRGIAKREAAQKLEELEAAEKGRGRKAK